MENPDGAPTIRAIQEWLGLLFIGYTICLILWGVGLAQTVFYFYHFPRDGKFRKLMVLCMIAVDCVHVALVSSLFWEMLVYNRRNHINASASNAHPWQMYGFLPAVNVVEIITQGYCCHRVWRISRGNKAVVSIIVIGILTAPTALCTALFYGPLPRLPTKTIIQLHLIPLLIVDGTIFASLVYYFNAARLGMPRTEPVLRQLILLSITTGLLLWLLTIIAYYMYDKDTEDPASILAPTFILSQLYVNSMMTALNSRRHFRAVVSRTMTYNVSIPETSRLAIE